MPYRAAKGRFWLPIKRKVCANFIKYVVDCEKKINKIVTCLKLAIEHAEVENHVFKMS